MAILITIRPPCLHHFGHCWSLQHTLHSFFHFTIPSLYKYYVKAYFSCNLACCVFQDSVWNNIHYKAQTAEGYMSTLTLALAGRRHCPCSSNRAHEITFAVSRVQVPDTERLRQRLAAPGDVLAEDENAADVAKIYRTQKLSLSFTHFPPFFPPG